MTERFLVSLAAALAFTLAPLTARAQETADCSDPELPPVLNLGLPRLPDSPQLKQPGRLEEKVQGLFQGFYARHGRCPAGTAQKIQVNIAVASEYEILDWLAQGLIDAAVVPDMTVFLLTRRDGIALKDLQVPEPLREGLLLPAFQSRMLSGQLTGGRWRPRSDPHGDFTAFLEQVWQQALEAPREPARPVPGYRIVLASHLSTPGFLDPLSRTAAWLKSRLQGQAEPGPLADRFWQAFFASAHFAVDCDSLERNPEPGSRSCWRLPAADEEGGKGPVEILFPGENTLRLLPPGAQPPGDPRGGEHLVMATQAAEKFFDGSGLRDAAVQLPPDLPPLFEAKPPLSAFSAILDPEPSFGVRTFGFSVDEVFQLLHRHQATSKGTNLALVLPGGGVKAAYQSKIIDELYQRGYLKNFQVPKVARGEPLDVQYVIGTSGGALLGFFVSQLGEKGPWDLSRILWKTQDGPAAKERFLQSTDIFNWTDLLRYASVVVSFLMLCGLMALFSIPEQSELSPGPKGGPALFRPRFMLLISGLLLVAPFLVRWSNGDSLKEQIPEFEGMVYAVLTMIAMVADQSLIHEDNDRPPCDPWLHPAVPVLVGGILVLSPLLARLLGDPFEILTTPVSFGTAFGVLAPLVLLGGLILPLRSNLIRQGWRGQRRLALDFLAPTGAALVLYRLLTHWGLSFKGPFFLMGLSLVGVIVGANYFLGLRGHRVQTDSWRWRYAYGAALLASTLLLLSLCWPEKADPAQPWRTFVGEHTFEVTRGTFLLCVGLLVGLLGAIAWIYDSNRRYHLRLRDFLLAYFIVLLHAVAVYGVLCAVIRLPYEWLSPLELTFEFWTWLLLTSLALGSLLLLAGLGRLGLRPGKAIRYLHDSFALLCSHHPNGNVVTRRFLRMAAFSVFSLVWWNLILAPALYGNKAAHEYLEKAVERFEKGQGPRGEGELEYQPTARFIAPANNLLQERDGTRYFLFIPPRGKCPSLPRRPASGAKWLLYEARMAGPEPGSGPCAHLPGDPVRAREFLHDVIFASGSPFPIFPAHLLTVEKDKEPLVDGGYSNNVPVDLALKVSANQVLIVDSTCPLDRPSPKTRLSRLGSWMFGDLVKNLSRLPGFLFERSQQVDRLSRHDLLVVSLAPAPDSSWPPLFDFRGKVVQKMESTAQSDLHRRIGLVESWGRPRFQLNVPVVGQRQ